MQSAKRAACFDRNFTNVRQVCQCDGPDRHCFKQEASPTSKKYLLETMGSGVALFDFDNNGRLDIFLANGARIDDPDEKRNSVSP